MTRATGDAHPSSSAYRKPSIRDVAHEAGVSIATVSQALNGRGRIGDDTKERIRAVAERLGYRANPSARRIRTARTGLVGLVLRLPAASSWGVADLEFLIRVERAFCDAVLAHQCYPVILGSRDLDDAIRTVPVDAVAIVDPLPDDPVLSQLHDASIPTVTLGRDVNRAHSWGCWADNDKKGLTASALDQLRRRGMGSVVLLSAETGQSYMTDVVDSFREWTARESMQSAVVTFAAPFSPRECYERVLDLVRSEAIDTIYLGVEYFLQPTLDALRDAGRRIPEDVQVMMASDTGAARSNQRSVSAIDLHPAELGRMLGDMIVEVLQDAAPSPVRRIVGGDVVHRETSRPEACLGPSRSSTDGSD